MPYSKTYTKKDGTKRVSFYADIRIRKNGVPTGERHRKLIPKVKNMTEAREAERKIAQALLYETPGVKCPLLTDFLETTYLEWARENKEAPHLDERIVKTLLASPHLRNRTLEEVSVIQIENFKRDRKGALSARSKPYKLSSLNNELVILSRAFRLAVDAGLTRSNPVRLAGRFEPDPYPFRVLQADEEATLWTALSAGPSYLLPAARLALLTGMREGEILALEKSAIDFHRDVLFVANPKWKKDPRRTEGLPFGREARALLLELCARATRLLFTLDGKHAPACTTLSNRFTLKARKVGLTGLKFHSLRHTFGSRLGEAGRSPYEIARLMGHSNIQTSMVYVHHATVALREAVESVSSAKAGQPAVAKKLGAV